MNLKNILLNLNIFKNNKYLDLYIQKIEENSNVEYVKGQMEKHHIIPRAYFKINGLKIDNSKNNLVYLSHFDHCLVHYYLCLCLEGELKYKNEYAFLKMVNIKTRFEFNLEVFLKQADKYNEIYDEFIKEQSNKAKERGKNGGTIKGKHCFTNGEKIIYSNVCPEGYWPGSPKKEKKHQKKQKKNIEKQQLKDQLLNIERK